MQKGRFIETNIALSDAEYEGWPPTFTVCRKHKEERFLEYPFAVVGEGPEQYCVMGHWIENTTRADD